MLNVRDQRRRAVGAPLAYRNLSSPAPVPASGVPTSDDRCIA
jgi:Iap family predicted aminopeptidase